MVQVPAHFGNLLYGKFQANFLQIPRWKAKFRRPARKPPSGEDFSPNHPSKSVQTRKSPPNNQTVHLIGAFVSVYGFQIQHMPDRGIFEGNSVGSVQ